MPYVAFRSTDSDSFVVRAVDDLNGSDPVYCYGEYPFSEADRLVYFPDVSPEDLVKLGAWAESQMEEGVLAFTGMTVKRVDVQGIYGVHAYMRDWTDSLHGEWDEVQSASDL